MTEKVSFNIASEASYVYILSEQKYHETEEVKPLNVAIVHFRRLWKISIFIDFLHGSHICG